MPLPTVVVEALKKTEDGSAYLFWTGNGLRKSAVADWQRAIRLFEIAGVTGHPHMFGHTFAIDLLARIPIEDVSVLLGHKSVRITSRFIVGTSKAFQFAGRQASRAATARAITIRSPLRRQSRDVSHLTQS